jgi:hypothetical protein
MNQVKNNILTTEQRIAFILKQRWIDYSIAQEILKKLDFLLNHPPINRMPNLGIIGETNNGKSALLSHFTSFHKPFIIPVYNELEAPVISIQAPPYPSEQAFYNILLTKINAPFRISERADKKMLQTISLLSKLKTRMLIIDEIHNILAGNTLKQRVFFNIIKYLANELKLVIVAAGTIEASQALRSDPQLSNRFEQVLLPKWEMNNDYLTLLVSFEQIINLKNGSGLKDTDIAYKILSMSEGIFGEILTIVQKSSIMAIESGVETINKKILNDIDYKSPSERKKRIDKKDIKDDKNIDEQLS